MATLVLATDGSEYSRQAAEEAVRLAERRDADLHALCVVDRRKVGEPALSTDELAAIAAEERGYDGVREVSEMAAEAGVAVDCEVRRGVPHEAILDRADELGAEAIVVGEHGERTGHLGGVGRRVADRADCEVVVASGED